MQFLCRLIALQVRQTSGTIWHLLSIPEEQFRQHTLQEQITHVRTFPTTARISYFKPLQGINKYVWSTQMVNISTCMNVCFRKGGTGKEHSHPWNISFHILSSRKRVSMGGAPFMITNRTDRDFLQANFLTLDMRSASQNFTNTLCFCFTWGTRLDQRWVLIRPQLSKKCVCVCVCGGGGGGGGGALVQRCIPCMSCSVVSQKSTNPQ